LQKVNPAPPLSARIALSNYEFMVLCCFSEIKQNANSNIAWCTFAAISKSFAIAFPVSRQIAQFRRPRGFPPQRPHIPIPVISQTP
jgi:hypothetical protein